MILYVLVARYDARLSHCRVGPGVSPLSWSECEPKKVSDESSSLSKSNQEISPDSSVGRAMDCSVRSHPLVAGSIPAREIHF